MPSLAQSQPGCLLCDTWEMSGGMCSVLVGGVDVVERGEYLGKMSSVLVGGVDVVERGECLGE